MIGPLLGTNLVSRMVDFVFRFQNIRGERAESAKG